MFFEIILIFPVNLASVPRFNNYDQQAIILDIQDHTVFTNTMSEEGMTFCPFDLLDIRIRFAFDTIDR